MANAKKLNASRGGSTERNWGGTVVVALFAASVVCGAIGWYQYEGVAMSLSWTDIAYRLLTLFTINASFDAPNVPPLLDLARFLAPAALAGTAIFVATRFFRARLSAARARFLYRGHVVFCGYNPRAVRLAIDIVPFRRVVFALDATDATAVAEATQAVEAIGATAVVGAGVSAALRRVGVGRASTVFVMGDSDRDAQEMSLCAMDFLRTVRPDRRPATFVEYSDDLSLRVAREHSDARAASERSVSLPVMRPFNLDSQLAREIVDRHLAVAKLDRGANRVAIFGFDALGQALAFEIAQLFHFPDLARPRVTVIDQGAREKWDTYRARHPGVEGVAEFHVMELGEWEDNPEPILPSLALIAMPDAALAFETARALRQMSVIAECQGALSRATDTAIMVIPPIGDDSSYPSSGGSAAFCAALDITVIPTDELINGMSVINRAERCDALARGIHFSWLSPGAVGQSAGSEPAWAPSALEAEWERLSDTLRDSNRYAARHLVVKLRSLGFVLVPAGTGRSPAKFDLASVSAEDADRIGRMEHNRWVAEKTLAGYLPIPSSAAHKADYRATYRLHPNLVPWEALSPEDRSKDLNVLRRLDDVLRSASLTLSRA